MSRSNHPIFIANTNYYSTLHVRVTKNACDFKLLTTDYRLASCDFFKQMVKSEDERKHFL